MSGRMTKQLRKIARDLPEAIETVTVRRHGIELLAKDSEAKDSQGEFIIASKFYSVSEVQPVDHMKNVFALYKKSGLAAVLDYGKQAWEYYNKNALQDE